MEAIIYSYINLVNGKRYIGQTINEEQRKYQHYNAAFKSKKDNKFYRAMRKYGYDNFHYEVLNTLFRRHFETDLEFYKAIDNSEIYFITNFDSLNNGYNLTSGGGGVRDYVYTDEVKLKMSNGKKGKISNNKGKIWSEERYSKPCGCNGQKINTYDIDNNLVKQYDSFTEAAEDLNITIPAITMFLKRSLTGYNRNLKLKLVKV